jgi:hypothetical protein
LKKEKEKKRPHFGWPVWGGLNHPHGQTLNIFFLWVLVLGGGQTTPLWPQGWFSHPQTDSVGLGVAKPPPWPMGVVRPPRGPWRLFGHPMGKPSIFLFFFYGFWPLATPNGQNLFIFYFFLLWDGSATHLFSFSFFLSSIFFFFKLFFKDFYYFFI